MPRRETIQRWLPPAGLLVVVAAVIPFVSARHGFFDLKVYHGAVAYWLADGGMIYDWIKPNSKYGFTYPPFAAVVMAPLAVLPFPLAAVVISTATVAAAVLVLWLLLDEPARRHGWHRGRLLAVAVTLAALLDPVRETFTFGQVNLLLLALVAWDVLVLGARGSRFAGMGIGLATAIKLTPGVFLLYLLVTRQWRAAAVATGTAAAATVGVAVLAPDASREFWTAALFDTNRVGNLAYVANQSLQGVVARWDPAYPSRLAWLVAVLLVVVLWVRRCRVADRPAALATTGALGCLISPVTWTHHLIWLIPALVLTALAAVEAGPGRRRRWLAGVAALGYLVLCSRVVWAWEDRAPGPGTFLLGSAYLWVTVALLVAVPVRARQDVVPAG